MIFLVEPLVGPRILNAQEAVLYHDEEDVLHDYDAAEGKDHQVGHSHKEPEINHIIEDVKE
jgi:hypothetical protein